MARSRNHKIIVMLLGSGYAAVMTAEYEDNPGEWMPDIEQTGIGRYRTRAEAVIEAKMWAEAEEAPFEGGE